MPEMEENTQQAQVTEDAAEGTKNEDADFQLRDCAYLFMACQLCCNCCLGFAIVILASMVAWELSGKTFLLPVEEHSFGPTCRVIFNPVTSLGVEFDLGTYGGDEIFKVEILPPQELEVALTKSGITANQLEEAETLNSEECKLLLVEGSLIDAQRVQLFDLPGVCDGARAGAWKKADGPMWAFPLIAGIVGWYVFRLLWLTVRAFVNFSVMTDEEQHEKGEQTDAEKNEEKLEELEEKSAQNQSDEDKAAIEDAKSSVEMDKFIQSISKGSGKKYFNAIMTGNMWVTWALLAPIANMEVHETCPQIVTSFYSYHAQTFLLSFPFVLCCGSALVFCAYLCCVGFIAGCLSCCIGEKKADELTSDEGTEYALWASVGCPTVPWYITALLYYASLMFFDWTWIFGININFSLAWPEFNLAVELSVMRILAFLLTMIDAADLSHKSYKQIKFWMGE